MQKRQKGRRACAICSLPHRRQRQGQGRRRVLAATHIPCSPTKKSEMSLRPMMMAAGTAKTTQKFCGRASEGGEWGGVRGGQRGGASLEGKGRTRRGREGGVQGACKGARLQQAHGGRAAREARAARGQHEHRPRAARVEVVEGRQVVRREAAARRDVVGRRQVEAPHQRVCARWGRGWGAETER